MSITVANRRTTRPDGERVVYVGRPSALGNPFHIGPDGTRSQVIAKYEMWLLRQVHACNPRVMPALAALQQLARTGDLTLVCHCAPLACHADVLAQYLREALELQP